MHYHLHIEFHVLGYKDLSRIPMELNSKFASCAIAYLVSTKMLNNFKGMSNYKKVVHMCNDRLRSDPPLPKVRETLVCSMTINVRSMHIHTGIQ
jgi:hypothetical protein